jgi:hypothetical protein
MAKTNDFDLCKEYLINYIQNIKKQLNQYQLELIKQSQSCPLIKTLSFDQIEITLSFDQIKHCLKQLVDRERKYLSMRNNDQLIKFKDDIHENILLKTISTSSLMNNQQVNLDI